MTIPKSVSMILVLLMACIGVSSGVVYKVGDSYGWNSNSNFDYKTWASTKKFHLGDHIYFEYNPKVDNVVRVTHLNFRSCNATRPIRVYNSGNDTILLRNQHSHLYFISSTPGHCEAGQKVNIRVYRPPAEANAPASAPSRAQESAAARPSLQSGAVALVATHLLVVAIGVLFH